MATHEGIPTEHAHTNFRSRLEARWACLFDAIGWAWEYEPFDCEGYIPDFAILGDRPFLVEVKPALTYGELTEHIDKVKRADREALIVGASPLLKDHWGDAVLAGCLLQLREYEDVVEEWDGLNPPRDKVALVRDFYDGPAEWFRCHVCHQVNVFHVDGSWDGYPCDHYEGNAHLGQISYDEIARFWAAARNATQWEARR
jgi:hypothetical protein